MSSENGRAESTLVSMETSEADEFTREWGENGRPVYAQRRLTPSLPLCVTWILIYSTPGSRTTTE